MVFRYRAIKKRGYSNSEWYLFSIYDCPAMLWDDSIFLAGKKDSPILAVHSVVRGHPSINMFEGDYVYGKKYHDKIGIVIYNNGFVVQKSVDGEQKTIDREHIYVKQGDKDSIELLNTFKDRTPIMFKCSDVIFSIMDFVSISGSILTIITSKKPLRVDLRGASELLVFKDKNQMQFEWDLVDDEYLKLD